MTRSRGTGLIGSLPSTLKQLTRLTWLFVTACAPPLSLWLIDTSRFRAIGRSLSGSGGLTGPFPTAVLDVKSLTFLSLSNNDLTGTIPSLDALSLLTSVDLSKNKFEGAAPPPPASVKSCTFDTSISESNCFVGLCRCIVVVCFVAHTRLLLQSSCTALCCGGTKRCSSALAPSGMASECDSSMVQAYAGCEAAYQQCSDPRLDTAVVCKCHEMFGTCLAGLGSDCVQVVRAIDSVRDACMAQRCSSDCYLASFGSPQSVPLTGIYVAVGVVGGLFIIGMVALYVYNMRRAHRMMMEQQEQQQQNPVVINSRMQTETPAP